LQGDKFMIYGGALNLEKLSLDCSSDGNEDDWDNSKLELVNDVLLLSPFRDVFCETATLKGRCPLTFCRRITLGSEKQD
jgi:hypothetical protein